MQEFPVGPVRFDAVAVAAVLERVNQLMDGARSSGPPSEDGLPELLEELTGHLALLILEVDAAYGKLPEHSAMRGPAEDVLRGARRLLGNLPPDLFAGVIVLGAYCRVLSALRWVHPLFEEARRHGVPYGGIRTDIGPPGRHRHARMRVPSVRGKGPGR